jgi:hypothetical protein
MGTARIDDFVLPRESGRCLSLENDRCSRLGRQGSSAFSEREFLNNKYEGESE